MCIRDRYVVCQAGQTYSRSWDDLAHVAGWGPHNLYDLARVSRVGSVLSHADPAQTPTTAGAERDNLDDDDLSDLFEV